ncbi:hypothetical protein GCM10027284_39630 [Cyclobacterium sediminis]
MENIYNFNLHNSDLDKPIWRYLDFSKFIDLLENKSLFFSKVDSYEDKYEGVHNAMGANDHYDITNDGELLKTKFPTDQRGKGNSERYKLYVTDLLETLKKCVGINCWRFNEFDSHAMWKIFLSSNEGVAIKTTVFKLKKSLITKSINQKIHIGRIKYIDYQKDKIPIDNFFNSFFYKNNYFYHESEFRILYYEIRNSNYPSLNNSNLIPINEKGVKLEIHLEDLIDEIILSPYSPDWFSNLVETICKERYHLNIPINKSIIGLQK